MVSAPAAPRLLVDGVEAARVPADDRGLLYGDGVFRTVRVVGGAPWLWSAHLAKLLHDADAIGMPVDEALEACVVEDVRRIVATDDGVLRITLTRGSGPRGYAPPARPAPRRVLSFAAGPLPGLRGGAVRLQLARTPLALTPALAGLKHLGRLEQVLACDEPAEPDVFDRLMLDPEGTVVCGSRCNLFLRVGRRLLTPAVDRAGVAGVVRDTVLGGRIPGATAWVDETQEVRVGLDDLARADELFVTNAVFGVRAVSSVLDVEGRELAAPRSGVGLAATLGEGFVRLTGEAA